MSVDIRQVEGEKKVCESIMRSLPNWFGIESTIHQYLEAIEHMPTFLGICGDQTAGFIALNFHNQYIAEIHVMGILPQFHRGGVGRALIDHAKNFCRSQGFEYLLVKTLGPSRQSKHYESTRSFYLACGFRPLGEFDGVWPDHPCLLMVQSL